MARCCVWGSNKTGSFGAGLSRHLALAGVPVLEVTGPEPAGRRSKGKDDKLDAVAAARAALTGQRVQVAKDRSGAVEALRVLRTTRSSAVKCRRAALQQLRNTVLAAPDEVREPLRYLDPHAADQDMRRLPSRHDGLAGRRRRIAHCAQGAGTAHSQPQRRIATLDAMIKPLVGGAGARPHRPGRHRCRERRRLHRGGR